MHFEGISLPCLLFPSGEESLGYHLLRGGMGQELETWKLGLLRDVSLHPTGKVLLPLQALYLSSLFCVCVCEYLPEAWRNNRSSFLDVEHASKSQL